MDNETFWKTVKPYFSNKESNSRRITLLEKDSILTNDKDISKTMNSFFINIAKNLNLKPHKNSSLNDINGITSNFDNHISIKDMKESFPNIVSSNFQEVSREIVKKEIINLKVKKSSTNGSIPAIILKQCVDVYLPLLTKAINHAITENIFPEKMKKSEVVPLQKKEDHLKKKNYRPMGLLPYVSKVFEKIIYKQIYIDMQDKLSKHITGFRKSHGTQ